MHYLDEGSGAPVVFVHGSPSWSFESASRREAQGPVPLRGARPLGVRSVGPQRPARGFHPASHAGNFALPRHIVGASDWLSTIWNDRETFAVKPALPL